MQVEQSDWSTLRNAGRRRRKTVHELVPFLAIWAVNYQRDYELNGLHPTHYDLLKKYGARMTDFKRATNAVVRTDLQLD